jgi:phospholipid/cholesterol/gamma-HCH transport system permease protein
MDSVKIKSSSGSEFVQIEETAGTVLITLSGSWTLNNLPPIEHTLRNILKQSFHGKTVTLDVSDLTLIDTAGMILYLDSCNTLKEKANVIEKGIHENNEFSRMIKLIEEYRPKESLPSEQALNPLLAVFDNIGRHFFNGIDSLILFFDFIGRTYAAFLRDLLHFSFRFKEISNLIKKVGITALPIIGITTFLIGVVIAFQSAVQLQQYGANIFIVEIVSISIARELSPILTSIVVAGRSGSAYTAQLGAMKITEELDAMSVMGFDIFRFLIVPRSLALIIVLPLLIFFGDVVGIFGGMLVAKFQLGITFTSFIDRLQSSFAMKHFYAGLIKGPFFAATIAAIGCFRGLQVTRDTESIGRQTTISVVNSIFMVIIIDAVFSILFTELGI